MARYVDEVHLCRLILKATGKTAHNGTSLESLVKGTAGKRLTYQQLTADWSCSA